jgi:hypothetical protein
MDNNFLNELMNRRNELVIKKNLKKINPNQTIKIESFKKNKNADYLTIGDEDILSVISKKIKIIEGNVNLILIDTKNNNEKLDNIKRITNSTFLSINNNKKCFAYLGLFIFFSQLLVTAINTYLIIEVFNDN